MNLFFSLVADIEGSGSGSSGCGCGCGWCWFDATCWSKVNSQLVSQSVNQSVELPVDLTEVNIGSQLAIVQFAVRS